ncbi:MAG: aldo/keto reductase [Solirubrobacteraceae bacterium]
MSTEPGTVPNVALGAGVDMPQLGLGVFQVPPEETSALVADGINAGYRSIDTAAAYRNEAGVGDAIARSEVAREDLFITTKLPNTEHGHAKALAQFERSLGQLGLDYVDLYLIHWPVPSQDLYVETWRALIEIAGTERARAIGVSNFNADHLERIIAATGVAPAVNQVELHPGFAQAALREVHRREGIVTESWSPLAQADRRVLEHPAITAAAAAHGRTAAQVILRWHIQLGCVVIPKASSPQRQAENIDVFDFVLADEEMIAIEAIDVVGRIGGDPATFVTQPENVDD